MATIAPVPPPAAPARRGRPKKPAEPPTRKHVLLTWRDPSQPDEWLKDPLAITSFNLNASGALALFYRACVQRILAPGEWKSVLLLKEEKIDPSEEGIPV